MTKFRRGNVDFPVTRCTSFCDPNHQAREGRAGVPSQQLLAAVGVVVCPWNYPEAVCMSDDVDTKIVLKQTFLSGGGDGIAQRVATVYMNGQEIRVWAPPEAKGNALDWVRHFSVLQLVDLNTEEEVGGARGILAARLVQEELQRQRRDSNRAEGVNLDGIHCDAQICLSGHVLHCDGSRFDPKAHCTQCGASCIDECPSCKEPIRGIEIHTPVTYYRRPSYCHGCGKPYPWMKERLDTARQLLYHDDKLTERDREELWPLLQYVMV
jgi:hypothetical protein